MIHGLRRLRFTFVVGFAVVAAGIGYWTVIDKTDLVSRQDNPRLVGEELSIRRGDILDRDEHVLVTSAPSPSAGRYAREYLHPEAAAVVGYYSLRHGTGGIESAFDPVLHGDRFLTPAQQLATRLLHRTIVGGDVRLTIETPLQQAARNALEGHTGAVIVMNAATGEILAMDSQPSYDPNSLDANWDKLRNDPGAPLLNRATQALYQPGGVLQAVILGEALNRREIALSDTWDGLPSVHLENSILPCASDGPVSARTYADAFLWGCPGPFQALGTMHGAQNLRASLSDFGLGELSAFDLPLAQSGPEELGSPAQVGLAAIGQGHLTVTPLEMALVAAAFANHGQMPVPRLVTAIRPPDADWVELPPEGTPRGTISRAGADAIAELMRQSAASGAAQAAYSPSPTIYGHVSLALAGPGSALNSWFIGFTYDAQDTPIAAAVLLENTQDVDTVAHIGGVLLSRSVTPGT